ncbi:M56 family metallopeptidase [Bythopirellula goksoeyrii]|uniref:Regulatory protein BlaR1 n=1 Tax=Bythopirellula goksoeyrii TaxID=1400387 RepID=A0A5B9QM28_9BACT|nr:M56 family metallopeptidase [Bythopirellula goksoeyrii]QEG35053.1 Regulatory protein BlaR1 [Bythopirellula goksoeyrii]
MNTLEVTRWLGDFYLLATLLLGAELLACLFAGQPARRMALAWATAGGLGLLALLCALPSWSTWHLRSPAPLVATRTLITNVPENQITDFPTPQAQNMSVQNSRGTVSEVQPIEIDWAAVSIYLYLIGSAIVVVWLALGAWQVRRLRRVGEVAPEKIQILLTELTPAERPIPSVKVLSKLPVAVAVGLIDPVILLPRTLVEQARTGQIRSVLAHELAHLQHRDLSLMAGLRMLMVVLWAHPLFWLWRRRVRLDQEVLADTAAAELTSRSVYAEELVELARYTSTSRVPRLASSVGLWETRSQLKQRLALLLDEKLTILRSCSRQWWVGSLVVLLGLAGGLSLVTLTPAEPTFESQAEVAETEETQPVIKETPAAENTAWERTNKLFSKLYENRQPNTIFGICVNENGKPLPNTRVEVYAARFRGIDGESQVIFSTATDSEGRYWFKDVIDIEKEFPDGLPDNNYFLPKNIRVITVISREPNRVPGFVGNSMSSEVARHGEAYVHQMPPAQPLRGRIVDGQGEPVVGARVSAGTLPRIRGIPGDINTAMTDSNGEYAIDDLAAYDAEQMKRDFEQSQQAGSSAMSTYAGNDGKPWVRWLWVKHPDFAMKRVAIDKIPGRIDVELQPGAVLTGRVVTQEAGKAPEPAKNVDVRLQRDMTPDWGWEFNFQTTGARTDKEGNYRFESLPSGKYSCVAETAGWVTQGIEGVALKRGETTETPDLLMTRGGRVRIQLIDDKTGEPLNFEKPTKGFVNPSPRPRRNHHYFTPNIVEFSPEGIGEKQVPAGNYLFYASVPGSEGQPGWQATTYDNIRTEEDRDALPTHELKEGEVLELELRMQKEQEIAKGRLMQSPPPSDDEKKSHPRKSTEFTPATPPADGADRDSYENGVFVPEDPEKLNEKLDIGIEALDDDAYENGVFEDKTPIQR